MEYYSALKKDEILPFATTWMDFENVTLSEVSQSEKLRTIFHSYVRHKTETHRYRQQCGGYQREGSGRIVKGKGGQLYGEKMI